MENLLRSQSLLGEEIAQTRPFRSLAQEANLGVIRTADLLRCRFADVVEPRGITLQQYNVLRILRGAGEDGLPTLEIAARMVEPSPGITRLIDRLEAKGWVRRERCPVDRRQVLCWITPAGLDLLSDLDDPMDEMHRRTLAALSLDEQRTLIHLLDSVRRAPAAERSLTPNDAKGEST